MKCCKQVIFASAVAVAVAAPANAQSTRDTNYAFVGDLSLGMRDTRSTDLASGGTTETAVDLLGAVSARGFVGQADYHYEIYSGEGNATPTGETTAPESFQMAGLHLGFRDPTRFQAGLFYGYTWSDLPNNTPPDTSFETAMYGVEAQLYLNDLTLYAQYGIADSQAGETTSIEGVHDGTVIRGVARWFVGEDSMLETELSYANTDTYIDDTDPGEFRGWGIKGKTRVTEEKPLYLTAGLRGASYDATVGEFDSTSEEVFFVSLSYMYGTKTLKDNDRNGASLSLPGLPGRAHGISQTLD